MKRHHALTRRTFTASAAGGVLGLAGCLGVLAGPDPQIVEREYHEETYEIRDPVTESTETRATIVVVVYNDGDAGGMHVVVETWDDQGNRVGKFTQPVYLEADQRAQIPVGGVIMDDLVDDYTVSVEPDDRIGPAYTPDFDDCPSQRGDDDDGMARVDCPMDT